MKHIKGYLLILAMLISYVGMAQTGPAVRIAWRQIEQGTTGNVAIVGVNGDGEWVTPPFLKLTDTAAMLSGYQSQINARVKYTDTASMLANLWTAIGLAALDANVVHKSGNETIGDVKTFTSSPVVPKATTSTQAVAKSQLDSVANNASTLYIKLAQKGAANGVATLDGSSKIPASQLPSIAITDVFTPASLGAMLALTAEVGDVAVRTDVDSSYILQSSPASAFANWVYLKSPSVASTDQVPEGSSNLYFTTARARSSISAGGDLSYNSTTGVMSYSTPAGLPPSGSAGGDLSGTYPNPTVAKFNGQLPTYYLSRSNHSGTQLASTISDFTTAARLTLSSAGTVSYNNSTGVITGAATNLGITGTTGARTITSSTGSNAIIPAATSSVSGVATAAQIKKLDSLAVLPIPYPEIFPATTSKTFTLTYTPTNKAYFFVLMNGVKLTDADWTISAKIVTLAFSPTMADRIEVYYSYLP